MKKRNLRILALALALCMTFSLLVSCGEQVAEHTHAYSDAYTHNEEAHWNECDCGEKANLENHLGGASTCTARAKCEKCGIEYGTLSAHDYVSAKKDENEHWYECACGEKNEISAHSYTTLNEKNDTTHQYRCVCGATDEAKEHELTIVLKTNKTRHWLKCECGFESGAIFHTLVNGVCECGYKDPSLVHTHKFDIFRCDENAHWYECECKEISEYETHFGGTSTCTALAECEKCTVSYGALAEHSYDTVIVSEATHRFECACGAKIEEINHTADNCVCGYTEQNHEHSFTILKTSASAHWYECECKLSVGYEAHKGGSSDCTLEAVCEVCELSYGAPSHKWNNGELITSPTVDSTGAICYTCEECAKTKIEIAEAGTEILTRKDLEEALTAVAWAYYMKGEKVQYDSIALSEINNHYGGTCRHTREVSPEYGTSDTTIFSVCTAFVYKVYLEALDRYLWEYKYCINGVVTSWLWMAADNQPETDFEAGTNTPDPLGENDRDMAIIRWVDFEKYKSSEEDELVDSYRFGVFDSTSFTDFYTKGTLEFKVDENGNYSYYLNSNKIDYSEAKALVYDYLTEKNADGDYVNLRPGDLITEDTHTLMYIGNGYVLDCNGYKYDVTTGVDDPEERGAIFGRMKTIESCINAAASDFVISRPLDYYSYDIDGNAANDIIKYNGETIEITEATESRLEYDAIEIDRTVNITPYGTAVKNDTLTYNVKITNKSNESNFKKWMALNQKGYIGKVYTDLVVTETIPEGTEFVSATGDYTIENGVITWVLDISIGSFEEVSYTVRVTADVGETIVNDGGFVANIPSNSIENRVGGEKLGDAAKQALNEIKNSDTTEWAGIYGTDLDFAENIYKALGFDLTLPAVSDIIENIFTPVTFEKLLSMNIRYPDIDSPYTMYQPQSDLSEEYRIIKNMIIDKYYGGSRLFDVDIEKYKEVGLQEFDFPKELDKVILEFSFDYLEIGDILVYATAKNRGETDLTSEIASARVLIYVGEETFIEMNTDGVGAVYSGEDSAKILESSFLDTNDIFFALRPSQIEGIIVND